ncbi:MAG TPA: TonB-dependent receptor [Kofleriaceae bacterium]|nr:TonB-dependent receptor [Kofleriaceae bacterium]
MKKALLLLLVAGRASAETPAVVDVQDLPPLPPAESDSASAAAVSSAASIEEDVVVGAAKREQSLGNVASAVTVISGDRLRRFGYRTVAEALRGVAGVFIDDDHISSRVGIRGLQVLGDFNTRVLVLIDGATVNEPWDQFVGLDWDLPVAIDDVSRIEVIRGPVSSVYGTNAFFGIINIITRGAAESPRAWGRVSATSFGGVAESAGFAQGDVDHQIRGTVAALSRAGETIDRDLDPNLGTTSLADGMTGFNAAVVGTYEGAFAQLRTYRRVRQLTYAPYDTLPGDADTHNVDEQLLAEGGYAHSIGKLALTVRGYVQRYQFQDHLTSAFAGQPAFEDVGDSFWYGGEVRGRYEIYDRDRLGITAGTELTHQHTRSQSHYVDGTGAVDIPKDFDLGGVYAEADSRPLPWLAFTGGVRFDGNTVVDNRVSPRAALFLSRGDDYGIKMLYAEGFRNPSAYEAFFFDNVSFVQPGHIASETIRSYESVLWGRPLPGLSLRLSGFRWETNNQIGQGDAADGSGLIQFQNLGALTSTGVEVEGSYRTASGWFGFGGGAIADVAAPGSMDAPTNAPSITASGGVSTPKLWGLAHLSTELLLVGAQHTRAGTDADAWLGWNATIYIPDVRKFDVTIGVRNLIGRRQQVVAPDDFDRHPDPDNPDMTVVVPVVPGEGREIFARVGYRY